MPGVSVAERIPSATSSATTDHIHTVKDPVDRVEARLPGFLFYGSTEKPRTAHTVYVSNDNYSILLK